MPSAPISVGNALKGGPFWCHEPSTSLFLIHLNGNDSLVLWTEVSPSVSDSRGQVYGVADLARQSGMGYRLDSLDFVGEGKPNRSFEKVRT